MDDISPWHTYIHNRITHTPIWRVKNLHNLNIQNVYIFFCEGILLDPWMGFCVGVCCCCAGIIRARVRRVIRAPVAIYQRTRLPSARKIYEFMYWLAINLALAYARRRPLSPVAVTRPLPRRRRRGSMRVICPRQLYFHIEFIGPGGIGVFYMVVHAQQLTPHRAPLKHACLCWWRTHCLHTRSGREPVHAIVRACIHFGRQVARWVCVCVYCWPCRYASLCDRKLMLSRCVCVLCWTIRRANFADTNGVCLKYIFWYNRI